MQKYEYSGISFLGTGQWGKGAPPGGAPSIKSLGSGLVGQVTGLHMPRWAAGIRTDVEVEYGRRNLHRHARVGNVHDTADMPFHRRAAQDGVDLFAGIAELLQIIDGVQASLLVRQRHIQVALSPRVL